MRITVKSSLIAMVSLLIALLAAQGWSALSRLEAIFATEQEIAENWMPSVKALADVKYTITRYRLGGTRHVLTSSDTEMKSLDERLAVLADSIREEFATYEKLISSEEERKIWNGFRKDWATYQAAQEKALVFSRKNENEQAAATFASTTDLFDKALAELDVDLALNEKGAHEAAKVAEVVYANARMIVIGFVAIALLAGLAAIVFVVLRVTKPLQKLTDAMSSVASGKLSADIPSQARADEIGDMARTLVVFRDGLAETERLRNQQIEREAEQAKHMEVERHRIADRFMATMGALAQSFVKSSGEVAEAARNLSATAEETSRQAASVAQAAEEASANVQTVAASTEELAASVREINGQVGHSTAIAGTAADEAASTEANIRSLSQAAEKIGDVVNLIRDIAGQTNLLALNATIEAARAGEAGKGFAVVASEVKQLAAQTAKATDEIAQKIGEIQAATGDTVQSISRIVGTIGSIREVTSSIAGAVTQQGAATDEISGNTHRAAQGANQVRENIAGVGHAAEMTGAAATQLMGLSGSLSSQADSLTHEVNDFVRTLRTA